MPNAIPTTQIEILTHLSGKAPYTGDVPNDALPIIQQLHDSGHIGGTIGTGMLAGPDNYVDNLHITTEGRLLLLQLQKEQHLASPWSRRWSWLGPLLGFLAGGIVAPLMVELLKKYL